MTLRGLPKAEGLRGFTGAAEEEEEDSAAAAAAAPEGAEEEFKLSCMFLIRLLMSDGGRGFFSGFTCGGKEGATAPPPLPFPDAAAAAASAVDRAS